MTFDYATFLSTLTERPGVYTMQDGIGDVLYVGKAKNLKKRVASYFRGRNDDRIQHMVSQIQHIDTVVTASEKEALLLETALIQSLQPKYNVVFKDDRSYPYLLLTANHDFARLVYYRGPQNIKGQYYGPYPSAIAVHHVLALMQKIFKLRQCSDSFFKSRKRPCLQYQLARCTAPCVNYISKEDYAKDVARAQLFLSGKQTDIIAGLVEEMHRAAEAQQFERAAILRDNIIHVQHIQEQQTVYIRKFIQDIREHGAKAVLSQQVEQKSKRPEAYQALQQALGLLEPIVRMECVDASHMMGEATVVACVVFDEMGPVKSAYRQYCIEGGGGDDYKALREALMRRFEKMKRTEQPLPTVLFIDGGKGQLNAAKQVFEELQLLGEVKLVAVAKGPLRKAGLEKLFMINESAVERATDNPHFWSEFQLPPHSDAFHLIQHIRDEAHRFAVASHRRRRDKKRRISPLEAIPGIGPKRRQIILSHFGGLQGLLAASEAAIAQLPGISQKLAKSIYLALHGE